MQNKEEEKAVAEKVKKFSDLLPKSEDESDDEALIAKLIGADGKLKVDLSLPKAYHEEIMAEQLVDALTNYEQTRQAYRGARNSGDNEKSGQLFKSMNYFRLLAAIIEAEHPTVKRIADGIMVGRVKVVEAARKQAG